MLSKKAQQLFFRFSKYGLLFFIFLWAAIPIHEWSHLTLLQFLGGDGYITRGLGGSGYVTFTEYPLYPNLVALAGGLSVVILYGLLCVFDWLSRDQVGALALLPIILQQLAYGIIEGIFIFKMPRKEFMVLSDQVTLIAFGIGFAISLYYVVKFITDDYYRSD